MKILLEQVGGHLVMTAQIKHADYGPDDIAQGIVNTVAPIGVIDATITDMVDELKDRQGVRRMSYNTWHWDLRKQREAEEYITYFYIKHGS